MVAASGQLSLQNIPSPGHTPVSSKPPPPTPRFILAMCRCPHPEHPDPAAGPGTSVCFPPLLHDASVTLPHRCLLRVPSVSLRSGPIVPRSQGKVWGLPTPLAPGGSFDSWSAGVAADVGSGPGRKALWCDTSLVSWWQVCRDSQSCGAQGATDSRPLLRA